MNVAVAVIINSNNQILVTQRYDPASPQVHLKWQLPGGGVNKNESIKDACIREVKEETGLVVKTTSKEPHKILQRIAGKEFMLCGFRAEPISGTINVEKDKETSDAKWLSRDEIARLETLTNTLEMIDACI